MPQNGYARRALLSGVAPVLSYSVLERNAPHAIRGYGRESELNDLIGAGVSAAAIWHMRQQLNHHGF